MQLPSIPSPTIDRRFISSMTFYRESLHRDRKAEENSTHVIQQERRDKLSSHLWGAIHASSMLIESHWLSLSVRGLTG
ncbi:hypothetical protein [Celerinatantimonas sp. YJH-8]|uniref:hypothetical protein n=1 Tax=Celerinatantimonas sp. YJH-8 TaxID=3228714 RepID=UPI0038C56752